jgi:ribose 5-phosphate isomerase RpiB
LNVEIAKHIAFSKKSNVQVILMGAQFLVSWVISESVTAWQKAKRAKKAQDRLNQLESLKAVKCPQQ